jgi:hypothetical protein
MGGVRLFVLFFRFRDFLRFFDSKIFTIFTTMIVNVCHPLCPSIALYRDHIGKIGIFWGFSGFLVIGNNSRSLLSA